MRGKTLFLMGLIIISVAKAGCTTRSNLPQDGILEQGIQVDETPEPTELTLIPEATPFVEAIPSPVPTQPPVLSSDAPEQAEGLAISKEEADSLKENTSNENKTFWLDLYEPVFENYRAIADIDPRNGYDFSIDTYALMDSWDYHLWEEVTYGYLLLDVDENGIPELLVGNMATSYENSIHTMFTLVENQPQRVLASRTRVYYCLSTIGDLYYHGTGGAMWHDDYICSYCGTTITPLYGCFTCGDNYVGKPGLYGNGCYRVSDGDRYSENYEQISGEEYSSYLHCLEESIIPLTDLTPIL